MDICSFDWELVSKFIPLLTSLVPIGITYAVYKIWHAQKNKELISKFAQDLIFKDMNFYDSFQKLTEENDVVAMCETIRDYYNNIKLFQYLIEEKHDKQLIQKIYNAHTQLRSDISHEPENFKEIRKNYNDQNRSNKTMFIKLLIKYIKFK